MPFLNFIKKERLIWHKRFIPSLIAGLAVAVITLFFKMTASNIVMFASLGASAAILTHKYVHRLNILYTVIFSYLIALMVSLPVFFMIQGFPFSTPISILIAVTLTTIISYLFNIFHPPAISASIAFLLIGGTMKERFLVFVSVIILLIIIKFLTYCFYYKKLDIKKFHNEFIFWKKKYIKKK